MASRPHQRQLVKPPFYLAAAFLCLVAIGCGPADNGPVPGGPVQITTPSGVSMTLLPVGEFIMGASGGHPDEAPPHRVVVSAFAIDTYEVTQAEYARLELPNPSHFKAPDRPVEQVRWSDAALFCNERSAREGLTPCYDDFDFTCDFAATGYRLPTEAEWEYAARAGTDTAYSFGGNPKDLARHGWYADNTKGKTEPTGRRRPNAWGLYDLHGNVLEWCQDVYDAAHYGGSAAQDPRGPASGEKRVMRGGAWNSGAAACRVTARCGEVPGITDACFARDTFGFRCVRRLTPGEEALRP